MTIALHGLLTEHWIVLTLLLLVFGVGFWGGVLQHAHLSPGDGGTLTSYQNLVIKDNTLTQVSNTVVGTAVGAIVIPANTIQPNQRIKFYACGWFDNTTGLAQTGPTIGLKIGGGSAFAVVGPVAAIPSDGNSNFWEIEVYGTRRPASNNCVMLGKIRWQDPLNPAVPKVNGFSFVLRGIDPTIDNTVNVFITNAVANVAYQTWYQGQAVMID